MPAYAYQYHWEETPDSRDRISERNMALTIAYRLPYGLSLGGTWLRNNSYEADSHIALASEGPSLGFVGAHFSYFYTVLQKPVLTFDYPSLDASTAYYAGKGSLMDVGWYFGQHWLRVGPRVLIIDVTYSKVNTRSGADTQTQALNGNPWHDRWMKPYLGFWFLF